jgi:hypothetical protein
MTESATEGSKSQRVPLRRACERSSCVCHEAHCRIFRQTNQPYIRTGECGGFGGYGSQSCFKRSYSREVELWRCGAGGRIIHGIVGNSVTFGRPAGGIHGARWRCPVDSDCQPVSPRKASQRRTRRSAPSQAQIGSVWSPGDMVQWQDRIGNFRRHLDDGEHAKIVIADRTYRVRVGDLV